MGGTVMGGVSIGGNPIGGNPIGGVSIGGTTIGGVTTGPMPTGGTVISGSVTGGIVISGTVISGIVIGGTVINGGGDVDGGPGGVGTGGGSVTAGGPVTGGPVTGGGSATGGGVGGSGTGDAVSVVGVVAGAGPGSTAAGVVAVLAVLAALAEMTRRGGSSADGASVTRSALAGAVRTAVVPASLDGAIGPTTATVITAPVATSGASVAPRRRRDRAGSSAHVDDARHPATGEGQERRRRPQPLVELFELVPAAAARRARRQVGLELARPPRPQRAAHEVDEQALRLGADRA